MNKKTIFIATVTLGLLFSSCKKEATTDPSTGIATMNPENKVTEQQQTIPTNPITESKTNAPATGTAVMSFEKKEHDFGVIKPESKVDYTFKFKNTGKEDLVISNAQGSCGCTIPEYPKEAIKPGESGKIKVSFNSAGKSGNQQKSVTITANTEAGKELLTIKAQIK